jgi:hypothetical protein
MMGVILTFIHRSVVLRVSLLRIPSFKLRFFWLLILLFTSGCAFYPTTAEQQPRADDCRMHTRALGLDYSEMPISSCDGGKEGAALCLAALGIIVPVGSFIASGSIVLVGNTLHWLEYHGSCDEGLLWSYIEDVD